MAKVKPADSDVDVSLDITSTVEITIPIAVNNAVGYEAQQIGAGRLALDDSQRMHVDIMLGAEEGNAFIKVRTALRGQGAKLNDGRPVWNNNDVLRWIFQQVNSQF